jgi:uncharacterized membrane protein
MFSQLRYWIRRSYRLITGSIAFYPAFIALLFVIMAVSMIWFDLSGPGAGLKGKMGWMGLRDASAARSIISTIAAGVIALTVFSFSMVMVVLNQAASQLSNRVLDQLIGNRFQQVVLGIYIGTIVFALLLLTTIREGDTGNSVPALSTYLLILLAVTDIFLFIYFLHYITRTVKYEVIIARIHKETRDAMDAQLTEAEAGPEEGHAPLPFVVCADRSGVHEEVEVKELLRYCDRHDIVVEINILPGTFILRGAPLLLVDRPIAEDVQNGLRPLVPLAQSESVEANFAFGFRQLTEVAMKALSPGINDPGAALLSLRALMDLYAYRLQHHPVSHFRNEAGRVRLTTRSWSFDQLFKGSMLAIWDYGHKDRSVQHELNEMLPQLATSSEEVKHMLERVHEAMDKAQAR